MGSGVSLLTIGNFAGEEWVFDKQYVQRKESCLAKDDSCVLEFTVESFDAQREYLLKNGMHKDVYMLESQLKSSYFVKKARNERFNGKNKC